MKAFIFDTETTGLIPNSVLSLGQQPRIIEFYGCLIDDQTGEQISEVEFFANPGAPIEPIITKITGIKDSDLAGQPPFSANADAVRSLVEAADVVVAHNLSFDMAMVENEFARIPADLRWPPRRICTVEQSEWYLGHRLNLTGLHEHLFGEPFAGAHRARHDVAALASCYLEMVKRRDA